MFSCVHLIPGRPRNSLVATWRNIVAFHIRRIPKSPPFLSARPQRQL
jgi:hypothetical protein